MAGGLVLAAASPAAGQIRSRAAGPPAGPTLTWLAREFQGDFNGPDNAVDIEYWVDLNGPGPEDDVPYVFITGWQTTSNGATVFATHKYEAVYTGPGENDPIVSKYYPPDPGTATGTNKAVAMALDHESGDVYVTGESSDPAGLNGQDYVTIMYDKDLDEVWTSVSRYDGSANGDDVPAEIAHFGRSSNVVAVTGRSPGVGTGDDIATVLYNTSDGSLASSHWPPGIDGPAGERRYDGPGVGPDWPVGVAVIEVVTSGEGDGYVDVFVGGTESTATEGDNIVTLAYWQGGLLAAARSFDGPEHGDDVATAMVLRVKRDSSGVYVPDYSFISTCGYTPGAVQGDTDYVVVSYWNFINGCHLPIPDPLCGVQDPWVFGDSPFRTWGGLAPAALSDDRPMAIDISDDNYLWITGRVREADGTDYDVGTIQYDMYGWTPDTPAPPDPTAEWIWGVLASTNEWGTAVDAHGDVAYVGGRVSRGARNYYATFKFDVGTLGMPVWTAL